MGKILRSIAACPVRQHTHIYLHSTLTQRIMQALQRYLTHMVTTACCVNYRKCPNLDVYLRNALPGTCKRHNKDSARAVKHSLSGSSPHLSTMTVPFRTLGRSRYMTFETCIICDPRLYISRGLFATKRHTTCVIPRTPLDRRWGRNVAVVHISHIIGSNDLFQ